MALVLNNRVRETTSTTGTGAVTLGGAVDGFQTFAAGIGNSNTTYYAISINTESEWEVGLGTLNGDSSTLTRTTVLESSNSDSAVDFAAGSKEIFCTLPSEKAVYLDASDNQVGGFSSVADDTTPQLGGDLDVNGNAIVSASDGAIAINANGTGMVTMTANSVTGDVIPGKFAGTNFTQSLLVGHSTTGTLDAAVQNTGVGALALDAITSGDANTCVGRSAGSAINSGGGNSYYGTGTGSSNTTSSNNTGIGADSLVYNVSGTANTAVGRTSMYGASGQSNNYNSALGYQSLLAITTGNYNTCVGHTSGNNITSGDGNVIIGDVAAGSATGDRQLMITGYDGSTTTTWIEGDSSGNITVPGTVTASGSVLASLGDVTALAVALG